MLKGEPSSPTRSKSARVSRPRTALQGTRRRSSTTRPFPIETFDIIVIDECHRSIYNLWRQVLEYFDASPDRPHRHADQADLRLLQPEPRDGVQPRAGRGRRRQRRLRRLPHPHRDHRRAARRSRPGSTSTSATARRARVRWEQLDEDLTYDRRPARPRRGRRGPDPHRDPHLPDKLFTEIFPGRTEVPKTLIFAKDDSHADDIVQIVPRGVRQGQRLLSEDHLPHRLHARCRKENRRGWEGDRGSRLEKNIESFA